MDIQEYNDIILNEQDDYWQNSIGILKQYDKNPKIYQRENIIVIESKEFTKLKKSDINKLIKYGWTILGNKLSKII